MNQRVHVLGICGTFMAGIAQLGRAMGHHLEGSDQAAYPPMSDQLAQAGITIHQPYDAAHFDPPPDVTVVGNALTRGNPAVEHLLNANLPMTSGPAWLADEVLRGREVIAVAGTHGKTTTSAMAAWILDWAGQQPGFLIGGVPSNFGVSARLGSLSERRRTPFVVEADEYDTAFFDKRSKFVHYRPKVLVINNLEFDHADIFDSIADIRKQFHHVVRTVPSQGQLVCPAGDPEVERTLRMGCWTPIARFGLASGADPSVDWTIANEDRAYTRFSIQYQGSPVGEVGWRQIGLHNALNALAAVAAVHAVGVSPHSACEALSRFEGVKRRLEVRGTVAGVTVYDDFAHHPTAVQATVGALRARVGEDRILAVLDPASNTMQMGVHEDRIADSLTGADLVWIYRPPDIQWDLRKATSALGVPVHIEPDLNSLVESVAQAAEDTDHVLIMSNSGFGGAHQRLLARLAEIAP